MYRRADRPTMRSAPHPGCDHGGRPMNQTYVLGWLAQRLEWERTLADLHAHAHLAGAAASTPTDDPARVEGVRPARMRDPKVRRWSPAWGMSRRRPALK